MNVLVVKFIVTAGYVDVSLNTTVQHHKLVVFVVLQIKMFLKTRNTCQVFYNIGIKYQLENVYARSKRSPIITS